MGEIIHPSKANEKGKYRRYPYNTGYGKLPH
jgi:hypothetical protein